jgi:2-dehydro-3-deoxyphosphogluconate aldolase / (4S)-4-hydroxy-2-oxoglutarate aldolase
MNKKEIIFNLIPQQGILPLYFNKDITVSVEILRALYRAGVKSVEYTNRGEAALTNFAAMKKVCEAEMKDMYLGVGTIKNAEMAQQFVDVGADYLISPGLVESVATVADKNDMLWVPGCMTPTEIIKAETLGAKFIKLFPGNLLGPDFMSGIKELFQGLKFMPTGGVDTTQENLSGWFKSGVCAVGMGSKLISKQLMEAKDYAAIEKDTKTVIETIKTVRN